MADAPIAEPAAVSPWAVAEAPAPVARPTVPAPGRELLLGLVCTLVLAGWIAIWAGWLGALALVAGVFVHEFGHLMVINWAGCGPSRIRIIPFFGGAATMTRAPDTDFRGVLIALAGPAFGLVAAIPFFLAADFTGVRAWMAGGFYVGALNLINLLPAAPLDGSKALGPALARVHPLLERGVMAAIAAAALVWAAERGSWLFAAVIAFGAVRAIAAGPAPRLARPLNAVEWIAGVALYALVVGACLTVTLAAANGAGLTLRLLPLHGFGGAR